MDAVAGFRVVPVVLYKGQPAHYLYIKKHAVKKEESELPEGRTLFVANVPWEFTETAFGEIFASCGGVDAAYFAVVASEHDERALGVTDDDGYESIRVGGTRTAHVVLATEKALAKAIKQKWGNVAVTKGLSTGSVGLKKWIADARAGRKDPESLQSEVDAFMSRFDAAQEEDRKQREAKATPDDEGWVTVVRNKRKDAPEAEDPAAKRQKKKKELLNFYRFQQREARRDQLADLRKKFEEDKSKIAQMKAARKFRPY